MIPVITISLAHSTDRRAALTRHMESLRIPLRFFDAVDGAALTADAARALCRRPNPRRYGTYLVPTEMACAISHRMVCAEIARGPNEFVCVIEDDVSLHPGAHAVLDEAVLRACPPFDILRLEAHSRPFLPVGHWGSMEIRAPYRPAYGLCAQIFTRRGAAKAAAGLSSPWLPCDMTLLTDGLVRGLRVLEVHPPVASHPLPSAHQSTIDRTGISFSPDGKPLHRRWRRSLFEAACRFRTWRNFVGLWGLPALRRLQD